jgi:hypothetical protein
MTIMFADVAGSVELYESLGDVNAHQIVTDCLETMTELVMRHHGKVIETIGDEVMAAFAKPDFAFTAACEIQDNVQANLHLPLSVRIGFHSGPTVVDRGHPFGDTVHVAARMAAIAKAGQVLISQQTFLKLSADNRRRTRHFNRIILKGKSAPTEIHEVIWDDVDSTKSYTHLTKHRYERQTVTGVRLTYHNKDVDVTEYNATITIGRADQCTFVVDSELASRLHATFTYQQGKVILADQSTNGTFIRSRASKASGDLLNLFIHHEQWIMQGSGVISLGEPMGTDPSKLIHFSCF